MADPDEEDKVHDVETPSHGLVQTGDTQAQEDLSAEDDPAGQDHKAEQGRHDSKSDPRVLDGTQ